MAIDQRNLPSYLGGDADFRAWGSGIAAQLTAIGLVRAADTGQIDWTTVARPAAVNTYAGYEVWRFNDALQATRPVFIKLEYGVAGSVDRPAVRYTVATATNGAGTMTGQVGTARALISMASTVAGAMTPSYCCGSSARLVLATNGSAATALIELVVERPRSSTGVDLDAAVLTFGSDNASGQYQLIPPSGTIGVAFTGLPTIDPAAGGAIPAIGVDVALSPVVAICGRIGFGSPLAYRAADIAALTPITLDFLGAPRTYLPIGVTRASHSHLGSQGVATVPLAIPWE